MLIERSGYFLNTSHDDRIDDVVVDVVARLMTLSDLADWFKARLVKR